LEVDTFGGYDEAVHEEYEQRGQTENDERVYGARARAFKESDCKKMMMKMPLEMRQKCRKMMTRCLKTLKEM